MLPELLKTYIEPGQLLYVLHPWASGADSPSAQAAAAAECAGQQGKFWEMHDPLFAEQETWTKAAEPREEFAAMQNRWAWMQRPCETCLDSDWAKQRVQAGNVVAALYGVPGAPVFLFNNGQGQQGSPTLESSRRMIDSILNQ